MSCWPVVLRELQDQARQPRTHWLRGLGAAALLGAGVFFWMEERGGRLDGGRLFHIMHWVLFWSIWFVVPLMTGDCISRERREGTLGLLFLTPLRAWDVVLAKGLAHALRGGTVVLAAVPVLTLPFVLGGVDWRHVVVSLALNGS